MVQQQSPPAGAYPRRPSDRSILLQTGQLSPRCRGSLTKGFETRYGDRFILQTATETPVSARPSRKTGLTNFTDPTNPFDRSLSKHITRIEDARSENDRAGARTRNPAMVPQEPGSALQRSMSEDGRHAVVAHRYSGDWRPAKRCPDRNPATQPMSPRCSDGFSHALPEGSMLERSVRTRTLGNFLNDMKRGKKSLRCVPAEASPSMQRMSDERVKLPAERRIDRTLCNYGVMPGTTRFVAVSGGETQPYTPRIRRSFSCDPRIRETRENEAEYNYGFARKTEVSGRWTSRASSPDLLSHPGQDEPPCTPRRAERLMQKADERFTEMVSYMQTANPEQKLKFKNIKNNSENTAGLLNHDTSIAQ